MLLIFRSIGGHDGMWRKQGTRGDFCPPRLSTFDFHGVSLRVLTGTAGDLWFIAADVCRGCGMAVGAGKSTTRYLTGLETSEKRVVSKTPTLDLGAPTTTLISESGLYKLVFRAQRSNPAARKFQDWVTKEVLPALRKDGGYIMGEEKVRTGEMSEDATHGNRPPTPRHRRGTAGPRYGPRRGPRLRGATDDPQAHQTVGRNTPLDGG